MNNEIKILLGNEFYSVFLQNGFYKESENKAPLHKHYHTEIQFVLGGNATCVTQNGKYKLNSGSALAIPANVYHYTEDILPNTKRASFFIDRKLDHEKLMTFSEELITPFFEEISSSIKTNNFIKLQGIITLFCCYCFDLELGSESNINYVFMIEDFFTLNFSTDVKLSDLAKHLNVSDKHASRLLFQYTGNNFTDEVTQRRMEIAEILINKGELNKYEISELVGYNSYSGFHRAYERYCSNKHSDDNN